MVRKQLYITDAQERVLKERARRYRITEAELVRRGIDHSLNQIDTILTEDFRDDGVLEGVRVLDPFRPSFDPATLA